MGASKSKVDIAPGIFNGVPDRVITCELHGTASFSDHTGKKAIDEIENGGIKILKYLGRPAMYTGLEFKVEGTEKQLTDIVSSQYGWLQSIEMVNPKRWQED